jgi:hypothetical protein
MIYRPEVITRGAGMDLTMQVAPLVTFLLGGVSAWWALRIRQRSERTAAIGVALADLLDVRHRLVVGALLAEIFRKESVPAEAMPQIRSLFANVIGEEPDLHPRYRKALAIVATVDPITSFELSSHDLLPRVFESWRSMAIQHGMNPSDVERFESQLREIARPYLDAAVIRLARAYSWLAFYTVRKMVRKKVELPSDLQSLLNSLRPPTS